MNKLDEMVVTVADESHLRYVQEIVALIDQIAQEPGVALARRSLETITEKIKKGLAVITLYRQTSVAGFGYISPWENEKFVSTSGLIVAKEFRKLGLAKKLKEKLFNLTREKFPNAIPFGITMNAAVMRLNSALGFVPVGYNEITSDDSFWTGCQTCPYHETLVKMERKICLCTAMIYDLHAKSKK